VEVFRDQNLEIYLVVEQLFRNVFDGDVGVGDYPHGKVMRIPKLGGGGDCRGFARTWWAFEKWIKV
jgi:hypothetical protein